MPIRRTCVFMACTAMLMAGAACGVEVRLTVTEDAKTARTAGVVTSGVPFAKGAVKDIGRLSVTVGGKAVPAQFVQLARWDDGSVRWALLDCQVDAPAGGKVELTVRSDGKNPKPAQPVKITDGADEMTVSAGAMQFVVGKKRPGLLKSLTVDGKELITSAGKGLVLYRPDGRPVVAGAPEKVTIEQAGPMKAIVCLRGKFPDVHQGLMGYTVRITAYAGRKFVKVHAWLENGGAHGYAPRDKPYKPEWFLFDGLAMDLGLGLGGEIGAACEGVVGGGKFKVLQYVKRASRDHKVYYEARYTLKDFLYKITGGAVELKTGKRTDGVVALTGSAGKLTAAIRGFWQNYEKAIELDGQTLKLWLWPTEGEWPRAVFHHWAPGYASRMMGALMKPGSYNMPGSVHKGHELILDFSGRPPAETHAELARPLLALASAEHYASTEAAPGLFAPPSVKTGEPECDAKLAAWTAMLKTVADPASKSSIWHARTDRNNPGTNWTVGFWYGWMDFGDFAIPGSGAVSLHYDWPWVMMAGAMRTGDVNFMRLGVEMLRHRIDVDQGWSDRELPRYRGFQRTGYSYADFHCSRFNYNRQPGVHTTWLAGLTLYYMLTGEPKAREAVERGASALRTEWKWISASDDYHIRRIPGDMQVVARSIFSYCSMHALTGEKKWLDEALALYRRCVPAKAKSYGPHLHDRQQIRSQGYTRDDIKYCYSIQAFCYLHHLTGEKDILALLKAGCDKEFPENFFDAPLFLADLNAYVALKTGEAGYLEEAVEHWLSTFPESKCPPAYLPENSAWSRNAAMMFRTGHLLQYAQWKMRRPK